MSNELKAANRAVVSRMWPMQLVADAEELYRLYHRQVYLYLLRLSGDGDAAEELLQETFYRALRGAAAYRGDAAPATWLCAIARRLWQNEQTRRTRERGRREEALLDQFPDQRPGLEASLLLHESIDQALHDLPEVHRVALLLRDADGFSYEEIATMLGISLASVKVTIHRARVRFRAAYRAEKEA